MVAGDAGTPSSSAWKRLVGSRSALLGCVVLLGVMAACLGSLPYTLGSARDAGAERYKAGSLEAFLLPPWWASHQADEAARLERVSAAAASDASIDPAPPYALGTDRLGRSLLIRLLAGGGVSIGVGIAAAVVSVCIGVLWGAVAGWVGGRTDAVMMRIVDVLYGLPYILLVVLFAVAGEALIERMRGSDGASAVGEAAARSRALIELVVLLLAIGGVSWLTMSRVIRGQVLSLKARPFIEAARASGVGPVGVFTRHLLPNLLGPIIVYATLTVPQAILQESFLSFLGIGVKPPLPSWGNLVSEGLSELNPVRVRWWLLVFPCVMLAVSLVCLNLVGEALRDAFDPRSRRR